MKVVCMPSLVWMCIRPKAARSVCGAHCLRRCRGWNCSGHLIFFVRSPAGLHAVKSSGGSLVLWFPMKDRRRVTKRARAAEHVQARRE